MSHVLLYPNPFRFKLHKKNTYKSPQNIWRMCWAKKKSILKISIVVTDNDDTNYQHNFQPRILNLKITLNNWKQRKLSLKGKITILNNLALTPLVYAASLVNTPQKEHLKKLIIWFKITFGMGQPPK